MTVYTIQPSPRAPKSQALIFAGNSPVGHGWRETEAWIWKLEPRFFRGASGFAEDTRALAEALAAYEKKHLSEESK